MSDIEAEGYLRRILCGINNLNEEYTVGHPCYDCGFPCMFGANICTRCVRPICNDCWAVRHTPTSTGHPRCLSPDTTNEVTT